MRLVLLSLIIALAPLGALAQSFGHNTANPGPQRHLLGIMLDYQDQAFDADRQPAYFQGLLYGPGATSVKSWYAAVSNGRFRVAKAAVVGPHRMPNDPATTENESLMACWPDNPVMACPNSRRGDAYQLNQAVLQAIAGGHDFKQYDTNGDRRVTSDELVVMAISADPGQGGGQRCFAVKDNRCIENCHTAGTGDQQVQVCLSSGLNLSSRANIATFLHEFGHMLGFIDVYGAWLPWGSNLNFMATLMSSTIDGNDGWVVGLDPVHRLSTGWVDAPKVVSTRGPSACLRLTPSGAPVVVYDPTRGPGEYLLLEYRRPAGADRNVAGLGVAVWHVRLDGGGFALDGQLIARKPLAAGAPAPSADIASRAGWKADDNPWILNNFWERIEWGADGWLNSKANAADDFYRSIALHILSPRLVDADRIWQTGSRGTPTFWRREHGVVVLNWPGEARTPVGAQLTVAAAEPDGIYVRIVTVATGTLPADAPAACVEATKPLPQSFPPPARLTIHPRCLTRDIRWAMVDGRRQPVKVPVLQAQAQLDLRAPATAETHVELSVVNGYAEPSQDDMPAGATKLPFKVTTGDRHTQATLTVRAEIRRPAALGVPPWTETVEATALILPSRGSMNCGDIARLGKDVEIRPPFRRPGPIPIGDGNHEVPVFLLEPIEEGMVLPVRPRPGRPKPLEVEVMELEAPR